MPHLTDRYPNDVPDFISTKPAPAEWQRRVQAMDPDLWIAWDPHWQEGPRWAIVRYVGHKHGLGVVPLIERGGWGGRQGFLKAIATAWSFVTALSWPDGTAADLSDMHILDLFRNDFFRKYGDRKGEAALLLTKEEGDIEEARDEAHRDLMHEAWQDTVSDKAITANATSVVMPGGS